MGVRIFFICTLIIYVIHQLLMHLISFYIESLFKIYLLLHSLKPIKLVKIDLYMPYLLYRVGVLLPEEISIRLPKSLSLPAALYKFVKL